jgi:secreted trypsin-like serine protease
MMSSKLRAFIVALLIIAPAHAIVHGELDGEGHPNVGGLVHPNGEWIRCSGTLIGPRTFLTAAHCVQDGSTSKVTFESEFTKRAKTYTGVAHRHPDYTHKQDDPHDIAVIILKSPINKIKPARLPEVDTLSDLDKSQEFTSVGYGAYEVNNQPGGKNIVHDDVRRMAIGTLNSVQPAWLSISQNPATGDGGSCFGDSGGPNFLGSSDIIATTTIIGDTFCRATNKSIRVDTSSARDFIDAYLT